MVLEFLGSSVDVSLAGPAVPDGSIAAYMERYGADPARYGPPAAPAAAGERDAHEPGHHHAADGDATAATVAQPTKVDNDLYVRDYSKCILCYKCVEACGEDAQNTFAIAVAGRGFDARISTEQAVPLPESACVYCGNCIGVCPTGALMAKPEYDMRAAGTWDPSRPDRDRRRSARTAASAASLDLHVQDDTILKVTSPLDSSVTDGHLCIKGRFGFEFVNERPPKRDRRRVRATDRRSASMTSSASTSGSARSSRPRRSRARASRRSALEIDFGPELGIRAHARRRSPSTTSRPRWSAARSAAVVNFPPRRIAGFVVRGA